MDSGKKLTQIHYNVDTNPKKVYKKAKKLGYTVEKLTRGVAHFSKNGNHVVSVKGTNPLNADDLLSDSSIATGNTNSDNQFKNRRKTIKKIYKSIPKEDYVTLVGHSLGGSIVTSAMAKSKSIRDKTAEAHAFNSGYTKSFHKEITANLDKKVRKELISKLNQHTVRGDIVSDGLKYGSVGTVVKHQAVKGSSALERHSLDRF